MTIIIFLVDTSASMNQRTYLGTTLLDVAKSAVETFMKIRSRDPNCRWDRYMLLTFEDPPANVKAGWKESHATFISELKNLQAVGLTSMGPALKHTFDLLNVNRMQSGIDTYGQGRCPFYLEPAMIICITDGRKMTGLGGVQHELNLPMDYAAVPGSELTKEPFRWDQRLFGLVVRIPATPPPENQSTYIPSADDAPIDAMCDVTGGQSYVITSQKTLNLCLESLMQKCSSGVVINFEKVGPDPPPVSGEDGEVNGVEDNHLPQGYSWQNCRKLIYVPRSAQKGFAVGHWPIPEAFWPDLNSSTLTPRTAHPVVKFSCSPCEAKVLENLPFDKYELEPSSLTQYILERRQPNVAWQVFVSSSARYSELGHPFGYLKASSNLLCVNLFVMPYNYPVLLGLLEELIKVLKLKPTQKWRQQFENYLATMPLYYVTPLRRALARMGIHNLVPDQLDSCLSYSVISYLKRLKNQAKMEYEKLVASVGQHVAVSEGIKIVSHSRTSILQRQDFNELLRHYGTNMSSLKQELTEYSTFTLTVPDGSIEPHMYRNPFDIPRRQLLNQVTKMRCKFLHATPPSSAATTKQDEDEMHNIPVQQMGNYQEYMKNMPQPLREIETQPVRQHTFGNPFKVNKNIMIDEADEVMAGPQAVRKRVNIEMGCASPAGSKKRKPGPLPKGVPVRQLISPTPDTSKQKTIGMNSSGEESDGSVTTDDEDIGWHPSTDLYNGDAELGNHMDAYTMSSGNGFMYSDHQPVTENHVLSKKDQAIIAKKNLALRMKVVRQVRTPGKNHKELFCLLNVIEGDLDTRRLFIHRIIHEAMRFKRRSLAEMLTKYEETMICQEVNATNGIGGDQKPPSR